MAGEEERTRVRESHTLTDNKILPSPSSKTQRSAKRSSKFNRILNNLERSILSQFSNQQNVNNNSKTTKPVKSSHSSSSVSHQTSSSANVPTPTSLQMASNLPCHTNKRCNNVQQVQKDSHPTTAVAAAAASREKITFQVAKTDPQRQQQKSSKSKMILNKYQQQIISTMCSNQLLVNNKLSIPPPHANDEARNQNHRLLFGGADTSIKNNCQSHDTDNGPSSSSRSSANKKADDMGNKIRQVAQLRSNSSPASSAVSLPAIPSKPGSQYHKSNKQSIKELNSSMLDADDESGFFTYQSQRSLLTKATTNSQDKTAGESQIKKSQNSSMILVPTTQVPMGKVDFNMVSSQQQYLYNYQTQPIQHLNQNHHQPHSQQSMNTQQQQLVASNQVPIISLDSITHPHISNNNDSNQQQQQQLSHMTSTQHPRGLNQFNNHHQSYASYCAPLTNVTVSSNTLLPYVGAHFDQEQQIYANAPPKPRRYQYYDSSQSMFPPPLMASQTQNLPSMSNNATILIKQPYNNQRLLTQQHQTNHPIYTNASYIQVPSLYQQHMVQGNHQQVNNHLQQQHHRQQLQINNPYAQHQHVGMPSTMTKSKSNLDARDLIRFKQSERQLADNDINRSNTLRSNNYQQAIYSSRYDNLNGYHNAPIQLSTQQPVEMSNYSQISNLQRSKSVSHLLADYNSYLTNCNQPHDLIINRRQTLTAPKFISVSSASTNNLNFVGLMPVNGQQVSQANQFVKVSSQLEISQPGQYNNNNHNDSMLQHNLAHNNLGSAKVYSATAIRQQRHQQRINHWSGLQASPNSNISYNSQQQLQQIRPINPIETNSIFANTNKKPVRQSPQHNSDNFALESSEGFSSKPSLDDKIRHLLIGGDSALIDGSMRAGDSVDASNVTYQPNSSTSNLSSQSAWAASMKQQAAKPILTTDQQLANGNFAYKSNEDAVSNGCENKSSPAQRLQQTQPLVNQNKDSNYSVATSALSDHLTNRIYINDSIAVSKMGNRQQRQYQLTNTSIKQQIESPSGQNSNSPRSKNDQISRSSQLIVDLTTPRVLAKTQTTLLPTLTTTQKQQSTIQTRDTASVWPTSSINQVGLPVQDSISVSGRGNNLTSEPINPVDSQTNANHRDDASTFSQSFNSHLSFNQNETDKKITPCFERTAPYYYSDLKSEEQRQALLSIVQQKSLSPPPKLLSRSTDQSSTRLALKSATLHAGQARVLSENLLAKQQQRQIGLRPKSGQPQVSIGSAGEFSSVCNITKNIDKLFDSPTDIAHRDNERLRVQSMLTLNENCFKNDNSNQDSIQTNSESISSGYYSGDLQKSKNLVTSKSKSLENLSQNIRATTTIDGESSITNKQKLRVPVYENIRCTDKLLSAINNSTTCLSTSRTSKQRFTESDSKNQLDDSTDSIFGSESLDDEDFDDGNESGSSLDIIDEIKISSSSNDQLSDISQLIEQLKNNHSKLSEEYRSTLFRISKIINSNNSHIADGSQFKNDKLAKRLQLLKRKSKKCETRSKNQLALIQMMEKVFKQSKQRASNSISTTNSSTVLATDSLVKSDVRGKSSDRDFIKSFGKDHQKRSLIQLDSVQKVKQNKAVSKQVPLVIKAIVTESKQVVKSELCDASEVLSRVNEGLRSSGRNHQDQQLKYGCSPAVDDKKKMTIVEGNLLSPSDACDHRSSSIGGGVVSKKMSNIEQMKFNEEASRNTNNNLDNNKTRIDDDDTGSSTDNSSSIFSDENETMSVERMHPENVPVSSPFIGNKLETNKKGLNALKSFMRDEEDFIEFLSTDGSSHRSQFEASQFSASDFNTSNSESSQSGGCHDSPTSAELFANEKSAKTGTTGILKKNSINGGDQNRTKPGDNDESNNNNIKSRDHGDSTANTPVIEKNSSNGNSSKFNNVLGNVIDVDVCSLNNLARYSPVNNPASC